MYFHLSTEQKGLLKDTLWLMKQSDYHRKMSLEKMRTYVLGPLLSDKLLVVHGSGGEPFGFCTYAFLPSDRETLYMSRPGSLDISDFEVVIHSNNAFRNFVMNYFKYLKDVIKN